MIGLLKGSQHGEMQGAIVEVKFKILNCHQSRAGLYAGLGFDQLFDSISTSSGSKTDIRAEPVYMREVSLSCRTQSVQCCS